MIHNFSVDFTTIADPGSVCSNPTISYTLPTNITLVCDNGAAGIDIQINDNLPGPYCITFLVDCSASCSSCGVIAVTKCFCVNPDDCENCSECVGNVCVSRCPDGKICYNDTCVDCDPTHPCPGNQVCSQGTCRCPAGTKLRADGICVECFDGEDLGNCLICEGGIIKAVDCPTGHCNQNTGDCQECLNNSHCTEPNQCCDENGDCDCCPGFVREPGTNECIPAPPCNNAQDCITQFGKCYYCTINGCAPKVCPAGFVCDPNTGECVPGCVNGVCPEGSGCLNGRCVPCSELSCLGIGELCQYAAGCKCNGPACEYINCNPDTVDLQWVVTPGTPGTPVPGSGLPTLQGSTLISPLGIVYLQPPAGAGYMNHSFSLGVTNGTNGTWTLYHDPATSVSLGSGTSVLFNLADTAPGNGPNLVGFVVKFVETGTGRTATWGIYRTPTTITEPNVWNYEFTSTGTAPNSTGGTPGSVSLCSTNGNFIPTGVTNVTTTDSIMVTFFPTGDGCLRAVISGCGTWNGDVILSCGGTSITVPAPSFTKDPANCCDPTDPNCDGWGTGDPCNGLTIQDIELDAFPTYGLNGGGDGEFLIVADWASAGLSFLQMFYLNPSDACWSVTGDAFIVTNAAQSPFGPSPSNLSVVVTLGDEGCIRLGYTCELKIEGCKKLQGERCINDCGGFTVDIVQIGTNTYTAVVSKSDEPVTFVWFYPGLVNNTGQTVTIVPVGGITSINVTASYGSPKKCAAYDSIQLTYSVPGCTNTAACNYMSTATVDDNSCVIVGNPTWDCVLGGFQAGTIDSQLNNATIQWTYLGVPITRSTNFEAGTYTIILNINGQDWCPRTLVVPQCYRCNGSDVCVPAPTGQNTGLYTNDPTCGGGCTKLIEININEDCTGNGTVLTITASGSTGNYVVTVNEVGGAIVVPPTAMSSNGSVTTPILGNGVYRTTITDPNTSNSKDYSTACHDCAEDLSALTGISLNCAGNYTVSYTVVADPFAEFYTVQLFAPGGAQVGTSQTWSNAGSYSLPIGYYPGDGVYNLKITNDLGCTKNYDVDFNCNGTLSPCIIESAGLTYVNGLTQTSFITDFVLTTGGGSYTVSLFTTTGGGVTNCNTAVPATLLSSQTVTGTAGTNTVTFANAINIPGVPTCYAVTVQKNGAGYESCNETVNVLVEPSGSSATCSGTVDNISYNTSTGATLVSWDFENTSDDLTVVINAYQGAVCGVGIPVTITESGHGENGLNIPFIGIPQLPGIAQSVEVIIYDTNDPTCTATLCLSNAIAGCTCAITINTSSIFVDPDAETIEFTYNSRCTSGVVDYTLSGGVASASGTGVGSTTGVTVTSAVITLAIVNYPSVGESSTLEITDDINVLCGETQTVALPANCVACAQVATFGDGASVVTSIVDVNSNVIATGSYDVAVPADLVTLETDVENGVVAEGGNFCGTGTKVNAVRSVALSGITVNQDNDNFVDLDHAVITSANWVGNRTVYFGDCGCNTGRTCTLTSVIDFTPISGETGDINLLLYYGDTGVGQFTKSVSVNLGTIGGIDGTDEAAVEAAITSAIENASCGYALGTVTVGWDLGTLTLTITVTGTNAGLGIINVFAADNVSAYIIEDFAQSACV